MARLIFWLLVLVLSLVIIVFAVLNRELVELDLWIYQTPPVPLFVLTLVGIFIGFIWGGLAAWFSAGKSRRRARSLYRRVEADEREKATLRRQIEKLQAGEKRAAIPPPPADAA
ncbi:MAG: LapA family protein [Rhodoplanes sp.]